MKHFTSVNHMILLEIGDQCNEAGLNKGILDIFLATGKGDTEFNLQLTNGKVSELYHFVFILLIMTLTLIELLMPFQRAY